MNTFAFKLNLAPRLFEPGTASALARALPSYDKAGEGQVFAIRSCYYNAFPELLRDLGRGFVVRCGNDIDILYYHQLSPH